MSLKYVTFEPVVLKNNSEYNEAWVQQRIADEPAIIGLGQLVLKDKERTQPKAGRLDILLQDPDSDTRYEVEIQLGATDESHIIRTIEYWDIERKRYPQYDHVAVIVAEDITSRFLNVITLFNGFIPLIAIQMKAMKCGECISLVFTKVLDQMPLGKDEEETEPETTDRAYWEGRATPQTVALADALLEQIRTFAPGVSLKYNKFYIGLARDGRADNFVTFIPQKSVIRLEARLAKDEALIKQIEETGLDLIDYSKWGQYRIRLTAENIREKAAFLTELMRKAYAQETA